MVFSHGKTPWKKQSDKKTTMKSKTKILLGAVFTAVLCLSIAVGATFAIFTTESKVDLTVTAGKINVTANVSDFSTYSAVVATSSDTGAFTDKNGNSYVHVETVPGQFSNGGSAEVKDNTVTLSNVSAGDKLRLILSVENDSTIDAKCRIVVRSDASEVAKYLVGNFISVSSDGSETVVPFSAAETYCSNWQQLVSSSTELILELELSIDCPLISPYIQNESCKLTFSVEATQNNAAEVNGVARIGDRLYSNLQDAANAVQANETLEIIQPGVYLPFEIKQPNVTVKGIVSGYEWADRYTSTIIRASGESQGVFINADNVTLDSLWLEDTRQYYNNSSIEGELWPMVHTEVENENISLERVTIRNCYMEGIGTYGYDIAVAAFAKNLLIENCHIRDFMCGIMMIDYAPTESFTVQNNYFENLKFAIAGSWSKQNPSIMENAQTASTNIYFKNNTMPDWTDPILVEMIDETQRDEIPTSAIKSEIVNNDGNFIYNFTYWDMFVETPHYCDAEETAPEAVRYRRRVEIEALGFKDDYGAYNDGQYLVLDENGERIYDILSDNLNTPLHVWLGSGGDTTEPLVQGRYQIWDQSTDLYYPFEVSWTKLSGKPTITLISNSNELYVESYRELSVLSRVVNNGNDLSDKTVLINDYDIYYYDDYQSFVPIGTKEHPFRGTFDGGNHSINDLKIDTSAQKGEYTGLFGYIENARIRNLILCGPNVVGYDNVGALVGGGKNSTIVNCSIYNNTVVSGVHNVGGIIGYSDQTTVTNCNVDKQYNTATISGSYDSVGHEGDNVGGIIGYTTAGTESQYTSHSGNSVIGAIITGTRNVGGLVGYLNRCVSIAYGSADNQVIDSEIRTTATDEYIADGHQNDIYVGGAVGEYVDTTSKLAQVNVSGCRIYGKAETTGVCGGSRNTTDKGDMSGISLSSNTLEIDGRTLATGKQYILGGNVLYNIMEFNLTEPIQITLDVTALSETFTVENIGSAEVTVQVVSGGSVVETHTLSQGMSFTLN